MDKVIATIHAAVNAAITEEATLLRLHFPLGRGGVTDAFQAALNGAAQSTEALIGFWRAPSLNEHFAAAFEVPPADVFSKLLAESSAELPGFALEFCRPNQVPPLRGPGTYTPLPLFHVSADGTGAVLTSMPTLAPKPELLAALAEFHGLRAVSLVGVLPSQMRKWCERQAWAMNFEPAHPATAGKGDAPRPTVPLSAFRPPLKEAPWDSLPPSMLMEARALPVWCRLEMITLAVSSATSSAQRANLRTQVNAMGGRRVRFVLAPEADLERFVEGMRGDVLERRAQQRSSKVARIAPIGSVAAEVIDVRLLEHGPSASLDETVSIVQTLLLGAIRRRASDLLFKQLENGDLRVRYNVNDRWEDVPGQWAPGCAETVIARIKVLAELPMDQRLRPMDGSITVEARHAHGASVKYLFRVNVCRDADGQRATLRPADNTNLPVLDDLAIPDRVLHFLRRILRRSTGLFIVTGPTGSGKNTTLYAALMIPGRNQIAVPEEQPEDPTSANALTFANCLRSILRQKPNIILVGEMRDDETAQIGLGAANTGHLVLSTLHTNRAYDAPLRLLSMGVNPVQLAETLAGVLAQRLVKLACPHCSQKVPLTPAILEEFALPPEIFVADQDVILDYNPDGCHECTKGITGRRAVFEVLTLEAPRERTLLTQVALAAHHGRAMPGNHESPGDVLAGAMKKLGYDSMLETCCSMAARCEIPMTEAAKFL